MAREDGMGGGLSRNKKKKKDVMPNQKGITAPKKAVSKSGMGEAAAKRRITQSDAREKRLQADSRRAKAAANTGSANAIKSPLGKFSLFNPFAKAVDKATGFKRKPKEVEGLKAGGMKKGYKMGGMKKKGYSMGGMKKKGMAAGGMKKKGFSMGGMKKKGMAMGGMKKSMKKGGKVRGAGIERRGLRKAKYI